MADIDYNPKDWLLVSEPGFFRVLADLGRILFLMLEFRSISRPTGSGFWGLKYRYFPGGPK